ncbi:MAG: lipid biosynthesis acyltransferase [Firmicutes bacterium]|nr:lipid biosynthesis acyltransferase [Bacillota bacterium]
MAIAWQYYTLKIVSFIVCRMPYSWILGIGKFLGRIYYLVAVRQRERALRQAQESLGLSAEKTEQIIRLSFINLAQSFLEISYTPALTKKNIQQYIEIENKHYLEQAVSKGIGVAVLTGHIGNWEWLGAGLSHYGFRVASIVKRQPNDQYMRILTEIREQAGIECYTRGTAELVSAVKALKKGRMLGFLTDQDAGPDGMFVDFLGKMASTYTGVAVFSQRFEIPVVPVFIIRRPEGGHKIVVGPPVEIEPSGNQENDIKNMVIKTTQIVESAIRQYPEEWLWFQKRWNTKWEGEKA